MEILTQYVREIARKLPKLFSALQGKIEKISGQIEAAAAQQTSSQNTPQPQPVVNAILHRPQAEIDEESGYHRRAEGRDNRRLTLETVGLWVGSIVAIANVGLFIVTYETGQTAQIAAQAAERSAHASEDQVLTTQEAIETTTTQFQLDQRAWVGISNVRLVAFNAQQAIAAITLINSGKTVARNIIVSAFFYSRQKNIVPDFDKERPPANIPQPSIANLFPNMSLSITPTLPRPNQELVSEVRSGDAILYVWGRIGYDDVFTPTTKKRHVTKFCAIYKPSLNVFENCQTYSFAD